MEHNLPLVSVAIITYNQIFFLQECIESILSQDYKNIEIVVADDCSTDGTQQMLLQYQDKYPGLFVLKLAAQNLGVTKNSNAAHFACSGKYIAWMGGDDLMLPQKISKQVAFMEKNADCSICYHNLDVFESSTNKTLYFFNANRKTREGGVHVSIKYGTFNGACSNMVRRSKIPLKGFNELLPIASDWLYWVETLHNGGNICYINEVLGRYRRHDNNVTNIILNKIGQSEIDHLNSCSFIMQLSSEYFYSVMFRYSTILLSLRRKNPYFLTLYYSIRMNFSLKALGAAFLYLITFGWVKL